MRAPSPAAPTVGVFCSRVTANISVFLPQRRRRYNSRMSDEKLSKPIWPAVVVFLIALPILYEASFGPAVWLYAKIGGPSGRDPAAWLYSYLELPTPIDLIIERLPDSISPGLRKAYE